MRTKTPESLAEVEVGLEIRDHRLRMVSGFKLGKSYFGATIAYEIPSIRGFIRFTWPEWLPNSCMIHDNRFRVWVTDQLADTHSGGDGSWQYQYSEKFNNEVLATGALFLDYGEEA